MSPELPQVSSCPAGICITFISLYNFLISLHILLVLLYIFLLRIVQDSCSGSLARDESGVKGKYYCVWVRVCQAPDQGNSGMLYNARDLKMLKIQICQQMQQYRFAAEPGRWVDRNPNSPRWSHLIKSTSHCL